uniref:Wsv220-like protein n=1 Tax=Metapenaeus ensis nimavirus TaxID=2133794 RepID=A0A401IPA3_9VIRU|nr:MAG: wsv220-like protein [Metapenaeus ensis nimavirus]GBG35430.1 wsv220-like protein [Metapenaeus ensis nimavirus]
MAGNRTELILKVLSEGIINMDHGVAQSCKLIEESLHTHLRDRENRWGKVNNGGTVKYSIDMNNLWRGKTPLLREVDKELSDKQYYATLVLLNVRAHYRYACAAHEILLEPLKKALLENFTSGDPGRRRIIKFRPHTLGAIKPPNPSEVMEALQKRMKDLGTPGHLDSSTVSSAVEALSLEADTFRRENAINNAFDVDFALRDLESLSGVVQLSEELKKEVIRELALNEQWRNGNNTGLDTVISDLVQRRPATCGVDWRPQQQQQVDGKQWSYPFQNIWGDNWISLETLSSLLTKVVIPNIELSMFLLNICNHIRATIKAIEVILFGGTAHPSIYFEDKRYCNWYTWLDLYNKLEWFMLTARYMLFLYSKKDTFLEEGLPQDEKECGLGLLAAATESFPPNLMEDDWLRSNLYQWPGDEQDMSEGVSTEVILSLGVRTSSGAVHSILNVKNESDYAITNRANIDSSHFCVNILLGRALDEEAVGTKMLVVPRTASLGGGDHDGNNNSKSTAVSLGILPLETLNRPKTNTDSSERHDSSPFVSNPTYWLRKLWDVEHANACSRREMTVLATKVLMSMSPVLFNNGDTIPGKEWTCLKLLDHYRATFLIHDVWDVVLQGRDPSGIVARTQKQLKSAADLAQDTFRECDLKTKKAANEIHSFLTDNIAEIKESNRNSSLCAERALYATTIWQKATTSILNLLASFPAEK